MNADHLTIRGITHIPARRTNTLEEILGEFPGVGRLFVADFPIVGAEGWEEIAGGWMTTSGATEVINIDHHAPGRRMERRVSSGNLAASRVAEQGAAAEGEPVAINHCDADSIISSAILRGLVESEERFLKAVIAADHSGAEDAIADALQSLEEERDLDLSLRTLQVLRDGGKLPGRAAALLRKRQKQREGLPALVGEAGRMRRFGPVTVIAADGRIPAEMLTPLLPDAAVFVVGFPREGGGYNMKVRLGEAAPEEKTLHNLGVASADPAYGGRWNAGSNKKGGGTRLDPFAYGEMLAPVVEERLAAG